LDLIDASGLALSSGGMRITDPTYIRMREIIWSNRAGAIEAMANGLPALAGVEPLIANELGDRYHPHDLGTANAGSLIAELIASPRLCTSQGSKNAGWLGSKNSHEVETA
jgi:hypothetical protein